MFRAGGVFSQPQVSLIGCELKTKQLSVGGVWSWLPDEHQRRTRLSV